MITPKEAWWALDEIVTANKKEIFYLNSPISIGNNQFQHALYFFAVHEGRLVNITPLLATYADLNVTDTQCLRVNGLADWPAQFIKVLEQKSFYANFLTLDQAKSAADLTMTFIPKPITPAIYVDEYTAGTEQPNEQPNEPSN